MVVWVIQIIAHASQGGAPLVISCSINQIVISIGKNPYINHKPWLWKFYTNLANYGAPPCSMHFNLVQNRSSSTQNPEPRQASGSGCVLCLACSSVGRRCGVWFHQIHRSFSTGNGHFCRKSTCSSWGLSSGQSWRLAPAALTCRKCVWVKFFTLFNRFNEVQCQTLVCVWNIFYLSIYWEQSSQLTDIFQRGGYTTNQKFNVRQCQLLSVVFLLEIVHQWSTGLGMLESPKVCNHVPPENPTFSWSSWVKLDIWLLDWFARGNSSFPCKRWVPTKGGPLFRQFQYPLVI